MHTPLVANTGAGSGPRQAQGRGIFFCDKSRQAVSTEWTPSQRSVPTRSPTRRWVINRADLGESETANETDLVCGVQAGDVEATSAVVHYLYGGSGPPVDPLSQKLAIPAYFDPGGASNPWTKLEGAGSLGGTVAIAVMNPDDGPGARLQTSYAKEVARAQGKHVKVLGYVHAQRPDPHHPGQFVPRPLAELYVEIDRYYCWYAVDGIFIDEVEALPTSKQLDYYRALHDNMAAHAHHFVVFNPGTNTDERYLELCDVIITFEDTFAEYGRWQPSGWEVKYAPTRFWHLVHTTAERDLPAALSRSKKFRVGYVYVTPDRLDNPWDSLPPDAYWKKELRAAKAER
jgi:hypothetical protein